MDHTTLHYYQKNAKGIASRYRQAGAGIALYFERAFAPGASVLDIGCGSGRDLNRLLMAGYDAWGVDICRAFLDAAEEYYPATRGRLVEAALPGLKGVGDHRFEGAVCAAVLMHLSHGGVVHSAEAMHRILKEGGRLLISVPQGLSLAGGRDAVGRLFNGMPPKEFQAIFEGAGFRMEALAEDGDSLGRTGRRWATLLFEKGSGKAP